MSGLQDLYAALNPVPSNKLCQGCSILGEKKNEYSIMDYTDLKHTQVLFLSDSFSYKFGKTRAFSKKERELLSTIYPGPKEHYQFSSSVKCPGVREGDMTPANMKLCRAHLEATIDKVKPVLVFPCGNLAMKMLIKKSGIMDKRGSSFSYTSPLGHECIVVPLYHPYSVIKEPRHRYLFETDVKNAYEKYILGKSRSSSFSYLTYSDIRDVAGIAAKLDNTRETIAVDIETTGLNFLKDEIMTIAISMKESTWVFPCDHKDSPFRKGQEDYGLFWGFIRKILENPHNKKVFHNAKFDVKFLLNYGISVQNVWDTKVMHHFINESAPKSLKDLVKLYFPNELESL